MAILKENQGLYTLILSGVSVLAMALMMFGIQSIAADVRARREDITIILVDVAGVKKDLKYQKEKIELNTDRVQRNSDTINYHHRTLGEPER